MNISLFNLKCFEVALFSYFVELKDAFAIFDKNNDGFIKKAEVKDILISLGKDGSDREVERVIKQVDADGNITVLWAVNVTVLRQPDF